MDEILRRMVARVNASAYIPNDVGERIKERVMAKPVKLKGGKEFSFVSKSGVEAKYPWDEWFNGDLLMLERSEGTENEKGTIEAPTTTRDYNVSTNAMIPKIHTAARRRYKVVQISRVDADGKRLQDALIIRARDMDQDERVAEDIKRAEERERRDAKAASEAMVEAGEPVATAS